jgi:hypothetical protein
MEVVRDRSAAPFNGPRIRRRRSTDKADRKSNTHQRPSRSHGKAVTFCAATSRSLLSKPELGNCESDQARAKHDDAGNGHSEEAVRGEFFTHGTPPVAAPALRERPRPCTVKDLSPANLILIRVDALMQHRFEGRYEGAATSNRFANTEDYELLGDLI